jgi:hypothetical protein
MTTTSIRSAVAGLGILLGALTFAACSSDSGSDNPTPTPSATGGSGTGGSGTGGSGTGGTSMGTGGTGTGGTGTGGSGTGGTGTGGTGTGGSGTGGAGGSGTGGTGMSTLTCKGANPPGGSCFAGTPATPGDYLNCCTDAQCTKYDNSKLSKLVGGKVPPLPLGFRTARSRCLSCSSSRGAARTSVLAP